MGALLARTDALANTDATSCSVLKGVQLGQHQATITDAIQVAAAGSVPEYCHVKVSINDSTLRSGLELDFSKSLIQLAD
ncbi:MAG: hypothetical protein EBT78_15345, partial [Betaproteobacteria bacterium]|nr:hypothetical protein [Betaproteobacteria bacterium]